MSFNLILFYLFAAVAVGTTLLVVVQSNPVYSVLLLIGSFIGLAGLYILLDAPFVAVIQIIVYAGAIMVLFLFVVMLLNAPREETVRARLLESGPARGIRRPAGDGVCRRACLGTHQVAHACIGVAACRRSGAPVLFGGRDRGASVSGYAFAFEATSILILVAMVGAITLAGRKARNG